MFNLKGARANAGLTQAQVCKSLNISKTTLRSYEKYKTKPDIDIAKKIASLYNLSVDDIKWSEG